ncbi:GlxA family transcriptional regulator [Paraburkholderia rhynchosiae]|uniref:AraC family transcriptional regulator n=1 Tax=Paraburkholderia rhynchosiae TaxID=487049 RepID=A0A2N7WKP1_9BURK|nr:helix-turn-helix domain-containing protein [Paraburkholderia rhynchosiae]PMS29911.1 AraC family transcriptional regulator [Paraburkholderia rhynchosiae]CAB3696266.1 HTH-type transcriptional activator RhaS [Paraburkholderia rhynchosiae]
MELVQTLPRYLRHNIESTQTSEVTHVDIALFNGFALPKIAAIIEVFQKANAVTAAQRPGGIYYDVSLLSAGGGRIASSSSVFVWTESVETHRGTNDRHLLFIAGGAGVQQACRDERLSNWLRRRHPFSEIVHPIAEGRQLLDATGLPSRYCALLYGESDAHDLYSARPLAEAPTAVSTALRLVEEHLGTDLTRQIAESIAPEHRTPFGTSTMRGASPQVSEKIMASVRWLEANVDRPVSIDAAAQVAAMSERNFLRRFKSEIGMTPSDYLLRARLNMSCKMLVESRLPVDKIARRCGIGSGGQLAKLFRKYLATTPSDYRMSKGAPLTDPS